MVGHISHTCLDVLFALAIALEGVLAEREQFAQCLSIGDLTR
jgi:hypothetical protein